LLIDDRFTDESTIWLFIILRKFFSKSNFKKVVLAYTSSLVISELKLIGSINKKLFFTSFNNTFLGEATKKDGKLVTKFLFEK
jgi:hypothetical protein